MKIVRVINVRDTRQYEEGPDGKFRPIPGSGHQHGCRRCSRLHEVHATVLLENGEEQVMGVGCAQKTSTVPAAKQAGTLQSLTQQMRALEFQRAHVAAVQQARAAAWVEAKALPTPEVTSMPHSTNPRITIYQMGDAWQWVHSPHPSALEYREALDSLASSWRVHRVEEKVGPLKTLPEIPKLDHKLRMLRARLEAAQQEGMVYAR